MKPKRPRKPRRLWDGMVECEGYPEPRVYIGYNGLYFGLPNAKTVYKYLGEFILWSEHQKRGGK